MPVHVAFLRAVNVGQRQVKMADLRVVLEDAGFDDVETYIQTGNVRVRTPLRSTAEVGAELARVIGDWKGFAVPCVVRTPAALRATVAAVDAVEPLLRPAGRRYVALADGTVAKDAAAVLDAWEEPGERVRVLGADVLAELGNGFQGTKLTNTRVEKITGLTTTWRDLKVVRALAERWGA
ncbi:DUF1697 domain-containing protein [Oryzobacter telluris]|uniref:DUF1697 domain-containing protein n=1 Tax=Oryzobacter telluris TaxID=3149179 RepID=UPI00370D43EE